MLATMPAYNLDFSSPHRPSVSSPLSSSPIRPSQRSPPLSPRNLNTLPRRDTQSSPIQQTPPPKFKFASRSAKPNPLRQKREDVQESRRNLFLKNVRQRADDKKWERRGGDQEALKLEWATIQRRWREQKNTDLDGIMFEDELDDIPEFSQESSQDSDDIMVDTLAQEEEEELNAMLSMLETQSSPQQPVQQSEPPSLSDDEDYDDIFMDLLSQEEEGSSQDFVSSGQMDMS